MEPGCHIPRQDTGHIVDEPAASDVSHSLDEWQQWLQGGSKVKGTNMVSLKDDSTFFKVAEFDRTSDPFDGGGAGIYQNLDIDLMQFSKINIWLIGKVFQRYIWWANKIVISEGKVHFD